MKTQVRLINDHIYFRLQRKSLKTLWKWTEVKSFYDEETAKKAYDNYIIHGIYTEVLYSGIMKDI